MLNAKQKTIDEFNNYFSSFDYEGAGISDKQVKTALALFMESLKRKFKDNPGTEIRNRLSYFIKSFTDAVSKITKTDEREEYLKALSGAEEDDDYQERLKDLANISWIDKDEEE